MEQRGLKETFLRPLVYSSDFISLQRKFKTTFFLLSTPKINQTLQQIAKKT
jgi:hypothetical protein